MRSTLNNRLKPQMLSAYNILEHNQDGKCDICYGEIADGNIINIAYKVNGGQIIPGDINYKDFLKGKQARKLSWKAILSKTDRHISGK